ncbi:MAG TPA: hypothetical protein VHW23_26125 [Kofleriaceae bacterium]|jgi:hypothetical protein|nr:hypothetical protein [Kofleriaceae bacterium]
MVRTRQRWGIIMLGVVVGVGLIACKKEGAGSSGDKSSEASGGPGGGDLALLPGDSEVVFGLNFGQMQQSAMWKQFVEPKLASGRGQRLMGEIKTRCGADPLKMVSSITVGGKDFSSDKPSLVVVGHGVDKAKILDCLDKSKDDIAKDGGQMTREGDLVLFKDEHGDAGALTFPNDTTAVLVAGSNGTAAGIKAIVAGTSSLKSSAPFLEMYKKVKTTDSVWGLASGKVMESVPLDLKATAAYGSLNVTDGLAIDMRVRFEKPEAAKQAADMANAQVKQAAQYFDKAEVTADSNELHASVSLSGQKLTQMLPLIQMAAGSMMGGN